MIAAYDSGISTLEADWPSVRDNCTMTGIITTTTGVLFMIAEASATTIRIIMIAVAGLDFALASAALVSASRLPVLTRAPITMNIAAIVQGAGFDRTASPAS